MNLKITINQRRYLYYYIFLGLLIFCKALGFGTTGSHFNYIVYASCAILGVAFLIIKICIEKYNKTEIIKIFLVTCLSLVVSIVSREYGFLFFSLAIIGQKKIDSYKCLKFASYIWVIGFFINLILIFNGVKENNPIYLYDENGITGIAYAYGYGHKNQFSIACFSSFLSYLYIRNNKKNIIDVTIVYILLFLLLKTAKSNTGLVIITLSYFLFLVSKIKTLKKILYRTYMIVVPICVFGTLFLTVLYKYGYADFFNSLFTGRLNLQLYWFENYLFTPFGRQVSNINVTIDNGYCALYFKYGLFCFLIFVYLYQKLIKKLIHEDKACELLLTTCFLVSGLTEGYFINPFMNISILLLGTIFFESKKTNSHSNKKIESTNELKESYNEKC